jgi:hypothetical protein
MEWTKGRFHISLDICLWRHFKVKLDVDRFGNEKRAMYDRTSHVDNT